jgi:uncharacterized protein (TIGR02147 family)
MQIFGNSDYKAFVNAWIAARPKGGRGAYRKIAQHLRISTVLVSLIFKGDRELTAEQALDLAAFLRLSSLETKYFLLMVQASRAGTHVLREHFRAEMRKLDEESLNLKNRVPGKQEISETAKAIYYSDWFYSGIRLLTSIPGNGSVERIADHFAMTKDEVRRAVDFLVQYGLCEVSRGQIRMLASHIHLDKDSPFIKVRQSSWRLKAIERIGKEKSDELFFTAPVALGRDDIARFRADLAKFIESWLAEVAETPAEELACLNIDWFRF